MSRYGPLPRATTTMATMPTWFFVLTVTFVTERRSASVGRHTVWATEQTDRLVSDRLGRTIESGFDANCRCLATERERPVAIINSGNREPIYEGYTIGA